MAEQGEAGVAETMRTAAEPALDKFEVAETVSRFYVTVQRYHTTGEGLQDLEDIVDERIAYMSPNFRDETRKPLPEFMEWFEGIQSVHAHGDRGSFFSLGFPVVSIDGDTAHLTSHLISSHWLSGGRGLSTWFFGPVEVELRRTPDGWRIGYLETFNVREEGHAPAINFRTPHLDAG